MNVAGDGGDSAMKNVCAVVLTSFMVLSCAPILSQDLLQTGIYDVPISTIKEQPEQQKGKLFILGGIIVNTSVTKEGSLIEAIYVPVNARGYLRSYGSSRGRFLALFRGKEPLDPVVFSEKREITIAGQFLGLRKGTIGEMDYSFPYFEIKEVYLWEERREPDYYYYGYPPYYGPPYYVPWGYRYNYYYPGRWRYY